jgi:hypothetical protein
MASRDSTGLMVAVILLVLLTVLLSFGTYVGMTKAYENHERMVEKEQAAKRADDHVKALTARVNILRSELGLDKSDAQQKDREMETLKEMAVKYGNQGGNFAAVVNELIKEIEADNSVYSADMQRYGNPGDANANNTWKKLIDHLVLAVDAKHQEATNANKRVENAELEKKDAIAQKQKEVDAAIADKKTAVDELAAEKRRHAEKEAETQSALTAAEEANRALNNEKQQLEQTLVNKTAALQTALDAQIQEYASLKQKYDAVTRQTFTIPDGKIVRVSRDSRIAFINVGQADGLRTSQTFEVFDRSITNFETGKGKGKIEVIGSIEPHVAEVRITDSNPLDPIMAGDHILTASWDPNTPVEIAIAGFIDMDGDKHNDRNRLENLIRMNGGKVVATYDDQGNVTGQMSPNTRYFVVGRPPSEVEGAANEAEIMNAWNALNSQAEKFHVQKISVQKFLNSMGHHGGEKIERMDSAIGTSTRQNQQNTKSDR